MSLTPKQQAFVDAYTGNGTEAARIAGYSGGDAALAVQASRMLKDPKIQAGIALRNAKGQAQRHDAAVVGRIASRQERQAFWTATMLDTGEEMSARLKASELLGKSEVDFTDKVKHDASDSFVSLLLEAQKRE